MTAIRRSADAKAAAIRRSMTHSGGERPPQPVCRATARAVDHRPRPPQTRSAAPGRVAGHRPGLAARSAPARPLRIRRAGCSFPGRHEPDHPHKSAREHPGRRQKSISHSLYVAEIASPARTDGRINPPPKRHGPTHHAPAVLDSARSSQTIPAHDAQLRSLTVTGVVMVAELNLPHAELAGGALPRSWGIWPVLGVAHGGSSACRRGDGCSGDQGRVAAAGRGLPALSLPGSGAGRSGDGGCHAEHLLCSAAQADTCAPGASQRESLSVI